MSNIWVLWPLLTPLGAFYNNVDAGDIDLPWASIAGFADVAVAMAVAVRFTARHRRRRSERVPAGSVARQRTTLDSPAPGADHPPVYGQPRCPITPIGRRVPEALGGRVMS